MNLSKEISRRRTFAIISHPDAGKTTLTEKFLLYGGAIQLAGSVTARKNQRATTSDWMELEKQRGISVSSTVLQFDYRDFAVNLLDTPGHRDFSEDTYRVLTAVDAAVMVIDAAKGIESQTHKLFEVCRQRGVPIFTFMNKCDRPGRDPLDLLDELEKVLGLEAFPVNWPLGSGNLFRGVYDRLQRKVSLFERVPGGKFRAPVQVSDFADPTVREAVDPEIYDQAAEELEILEAAGADFSREAVSQGKVTPVFFGSAVNNFGVQHLLDGFLQMSPPPAPRKSKGETVPTSREAFSGFIFKIQANMNLQHRDRMVFVRICSGTFNRDMSVQHVQSGKKIRLSFSQKMFGEERETLDYAVAGDILGLAGHTDFNLGDTLTEDPGICYDELPVFAPECFAYIHNPDTGRFKRFRAGLEQLLQEKVVQRFTLPDAATNIPLLAAVGPLQFDVVQFRLKTEYGCETRLENTPWKITRWLPAGWTWEDTRRLIIPNGARAALDGSDRPVILFTADWLLHHFAEKNKEIALTPIPPRAAAAVQAT